MATRRAFLASAGLAGYGAWALLKPPPHSNAGKPPKSTTTTTVAPTTTTLACQDLVTEDVREVFC